MALNDVIARFATGVYEIITATSGKYVDGVRSSDESAPDLVVTAVDADLDTLTSVAHGLTSGDGPLRLVDLADGGVLPMGLSVDVPVFAIVIDVDTVSLAETEAAALAGTPVIDIGDVGAGSFKISSSRKIATMCIQPAKGKDLDPLPETDRTDDVKLVFCGEELLTRRPGRDPDVILIKGERYIIKHDDIWEHWGATHWKCLARRERVT